MLITKCKKQIKLCNKKLATGKKREPFMSLKSNSFHKRMKTWKRNSVQPTQN